MSLDLGMNSMFLEAETDFGLSLLRHAPMNGSLVVSPLSVMFALAMVQLGSRGNTKAQIDSVLSKGAGHRGIVEHYSKLSRQIMQAKNGVKTKIGNGFFLNKGYQIRNDYENAITKNFAARVESLNFYQAEEAAQVIDGYISDATEGKIHDMVKANDVKGAFSLLVNAIYFSAEWIISFDNNTNTKQIFYSSEHIKREIEFMNDNNIWPYAEDLDFQVLSLLYKDDAYAFNIFLPKRWFGLKELKKTLNGTRIQNLLSKTSGTRLSISIPKMKIETDYKLNEALMRMGITDIFNNNADLTGITSSSIRVSDVSHKAMIEVYENGTTAAAATVVRMVEISDRRIIAIPFVADHPFLFVLTKDRNPLFMGEFV